METLINPAKMYTYQLKSDIILASWAYELSVESMEFLNSVKELFQFAKELNLKKILIDSGTPAGGVLTEDVMLLIQESIVNVAAEKIALLETSDFHWDNNLLQFFKYLKNFLQLSYEVRLFSNKQKALDWLSV